MSSDTPSERVEQARDALGQLAWDSDCRADLNPVMDELIAAVRAEERAKVREMVEGMRKDSRPARYLEAVAQQQGEQAAFEAVLALLSDETPE
jgi:hypothetical protein